MGRTARQHHGGNNQKPKLLKNQLVPNQLLRAEIVRIAGRVKENKQMWARNQLQLVPTRMV